VSCEIVASILHNGTTIHAPIGGNMKYAYCFAVVAGLLVLGGCVSEPNYSADPNVLIVGAQPPSGYPMTQLVRTGNFCMQVTDSWSGTVDPATGTQIWLKQTSRVPVACQ
jgi:hypothetical protein